MMLRISSMSVLRIKNENAQDPSCIVRHLTRMQPSDRVELSRSPRNAESEELKFVPDTSKWFQEMGSVVAAASSMPATRQATTSFAFVSGGRLVPDLGDLAILNSKRKLF